MTTKGLLTTQLILLALLFFGACVAAAAPITWSAVYDAAGPADVHNGTVGPFNTFVDSSTFWSSDLAINGVNFNRYDHKIVPGQNDGAPFAYGFANGSNITIDSDSTYGSEPSGYAATPTNDYERLTNKSAYFSSSKAYVITLGGLEVGSRYQVQLFGPDWNVNWHTFEYGDGQGNSTGLMHTGGDLAGSSGPPQYVFGTFVADATTQEIFMGPFSRSYGFAPAVSLFTVPEPSAFLLLCGVGLLGVTQRRRRKML